MRRRLNSLKFCSAHDAKATPPRFQCCTACRSAPFCAMCQLSDVSHVQIAAEMLCNNVVKDFNFVDFWAGEQGLKGGDSLGKRLFTSPFPPKMSIPFFELIKT